MSNSFVEGLGISEERMNKIVTLALQTVENGVTLSAAFAANGGKFSDFFAELEKLQKEDVKLLTSVEEGVIYGYALNEAANAVLPYRVSGKLTIDIDALIDELKGKPED